MGRFLSDIGLDHGHLWTIDLCQIEFGTLLNTFEDNKMISPALEIDKKNMSKYLSTILILSACPRSGLAQFKMTHVTF